MKEMKEKLVSLMASAEECRDRGQSSDSTVLAETLILSSARC